MSKSVDFMYLRISRRAIVPGLCLILRTPVAAPDLASSFFFNALLPSCFLGALPSVVFLAVCLVLAIYNNDEEFSDVTFLVEGKKVYGHRMVLSLVSDCFRAMFTNGFRESNVTEIEIPHCSHQAFVTMMEYIYTGQTPHILLEGDNMPGGVAKVVELLELADQFFLDHLKQVCERMLQPMVRMDTYEFMLSVAQKTNAKQLENVCRHFERNMDHIEEDALTEQRQRQQPTIGHIGLW